MLSISLVKSALLNSLSLLKWIKMIFHIQIALKVNFTSLQVDNVATAIESTDKPVYPQLQTKLCNMQRPNIPVLVSILCTLPVTSCSAERSFSAVKRIKTALRSSMGTARLTGLALCHLHHDIPLMLSTSSHYAITEGN